MKTRSYIFFFLLFIAMSVNAQLLKQFNCPIIINGSNATTGNNIEITGDITSQATIVDANDLLAGDMIYDAMRRTYKILNKLPDNGGTTFSVEAVYLGGGPGGIDPAPSPGIISRPTTSGFPLISDDELYAAVLNSAIMTVDATMVKHNTGSTLPTVTGAVVGAVVYNSTDNNVWRLTLVGWEKVTNISESYMDDPSIDPYVGPAGKIVNNQVAPLGYYISNGTAWLTVPTVSSLPDLMPKFGDVFAVTGDKLYMFGASGKWEPISGSAAVSPGTTFPTSPKIGDFYYDTNANILYVYDATSTWKEVSVNGSTPNNSPAPTPTKEGELYFNSTDKKLYVNNGTQWISVDNSLPAGKVFIGNASGEATPVSLTGDVTVNSFGVTAIGAAKVTNAQLNKAAIPLSGFAVPTANIDMGAKQITNLATPTTNTDATTKLYVDTHTISLSAIPLGTGHLLRGSAGVATDVAQSTIPISGFGAAVDSVFMGNGTTNYRIVNLKDPITPQSAATKKYVDATSGCVPIGVIPPTSPLIGTIYYNITEKRLWIYQGGSWRPADNSLDTDMMYVGDVNGIAAPTLKSNILLSGFGAAAADVSFGGFKITNLADPIAGVAGLQNAATRKYVDDKVAAVSTPSGPVLPGTPTEGNTFYNTTSHLYYVYNGTDWIPTGNDLLNNQLYVGDVNNKAVSTPKANIPLSGFGAATADVTMGGFKITNLADPVAGAAGLQNATTRKYVDDKIAAVTTTTGAGYPPTTPVPAAGTTYYDTLNKIYYVSNGTDWIPMGNDLLANELYVGDVNNKAVSTPKNTIPLSGFGAATVDVSMGNFKITNLADPVAGAAGLQNAATRKYVDDKTGSVPTTPSGTPVLGSTYYNTTDKLFYVYDGTGWIPVNNVLPNGQLYVGDASNKAVATSKSAITLSGFGDAQANVSMGTGSNNYKIINVADPAGDQDAATKKYVDSKTGSVTTGTTPPASPTVGTTYYNTTDKTFYVYDGTGWVPVDNKLPTGQLYVGDASNKAAATAKNTIPLSGFAAAATDVALGGFKLTGVADPAGDQDAATKKYVDGKTGTVTTGTTPPASPTVGTTYYNTTDKTFYVYDGTGWVPVNNILPTGQLYVGDATNKAAATAKNTIPLSGFAAAAADIDLGSHKIANVVDPTGNQDAATKKYVDSKTGSVTTGTTPPPAPTTGTTYYNTTDKTFYVYDGTGWVPVNNILPNGELYVGDATNKAVPVAKSSITLSGFGDAQANISMGTGSNNYKIINVADPAGDQDAATKKYVDGKTGTVTTGTTPPASPTVGTTYYNTTDKILYVFDGTGWVPVNNILPTGQLYVGDASNKAAATAKSAVPLSGFGTPTSNIDFGAFKITSLGDPTADQEAATKKYVDSKTGSVTTGTTPPPSPTTGATYYNTTDKTFYVYDGTQWLPVNNILPNGEFYVGDASNKAVPVAKSSITLSGFGDAEANISMGTGSNNYKIINVADPAGDQDAATKKYVDSKTAGVTTGTTPPTGPTTGTTYYNTTDKILYVYDGTGWVPAVPGDNLGNHTATKNIKMATYAISNDGVDGKGLTFETAGNAIFAQDVTVKGNFYTPSDKRLKTNIETLGNTLQAIDSMRGVRFEYKDQKRYAKGSKIGVIAQELMKVYPEMVVKGADGFYKVDYTQLSAVLIQAMKEQQQKMKQQQSEIDELKTRLDKQQMQINTILKKIN